MALVLWITILLLGFVALYYGAEWLVYGASVIAYHFYIPKTVIGLTLVALGTSAPEFFVNVIAAFRQETAFALSNVGGSNLTNLLVGFGLMSLIRPIPLPRRLMISDATVMLLAATVVAASLSLAAAPSMAVWTLAPLGALLAYYLYSLSLRRFAERDEEPEMAALRRGGAVFLVGVASLYVGGEMVFRAAMAIAHLAQIPTSIVGLTVVACGTSIPDVTASVVATRREEFGIAAGNLIGSNISNVLFVLPATLIASGGPLHAGPGIPADYLAVCGTSLVFVLLLARFERLSRRTGTAFLLFFAAYYTVRVAMALGPSLEFTL